MLIHKLVHAGGERKRRLRVMMMNCGLILALGFIRFYHYEGIKLPDAGKP